MKFSEKISIDEFDGKRFQIRLIEPDNNKKAVLTHYLHNIDNGVAQHYKEDALKALEELITYKQKEENFSYAADIALQQLLFEVENVPFPTPENYNFKFIDLFAGIGGFRLAMQNLGGKCVFTSEWDKEAQKTYRANFGEVPFGDITKEQVKNYIPDEFDVLCAGFPCQPFSIAGKRGGFDDTRGTLFFDVAEIIKKHKPKAIFLENVKGLRNHDKGKTLEVIMNTLEELNYTVFTQIINSADFGVPQNRERIFIVGFNNDKISNLDFKFPRPNDKPVFVNQFLEKNINGYSISKHLQQSYIFKKDDGKPQIIDKNSEIQVKTLVSTYHKIQRLTGTFVRDGETDLRLLTINECKNIMGFPKNYIIPVSRTQAYRQFGNSVAVPAIQATAKEILKQIGIKKS
jgi:DNA (cytosine-5)-methyltransferase 1